MGDTLDVLGQLYGYNFADANTYTTPMTSDFSFSASGPLYTSSVSPGADVWAESGATYQPQVQSVPDSGSTLALLTLAGAALLLTARFRARATVRHVG